MNITPIYGDITPDLLRNDLTMIVITPSELSSPDSGNHRADTLISACRQAGKLACGHVVLAYSYDSDPREIYEIPEVVRHISRLFDAFPQLAYFIPPDLEILRPLLLAYYGAMVIGSSRPGMAQVGIPDIDGARQKSKKLRDAAVSYGKSIGDPLSGKLAARAIESLGI